jgi:hypothetical protein
VNTISHYDPLVLSVVLEIFSLDVKKYDKDKKFIFYVCPKEEDEDGLQQKFHELNWCILKMISKNNKYIQLGFLKI